MIGAIIGDVVGSRFEFNNTSKYDFELFVDYCSFTDDTVCTIAIADAILKGCEYKESMLQWCRRYPHPMGSYGSSFAKWFISDNPQPYNSFGNGAAMRVSPVGWAFDNRDEVVCQAGASAAFSHNHPEGIKGATAVALGIYMLRTKNESFDSIMLDLYGADWADDLPLKGIFDVTCQGCVPLAFHILSQSNSFEDALRRAVSYGGDSDTMGAIVGSLAEARYGIDIDMQAKVMKYLPSDMRMVVEEFRKKYCCED